LLRIWTGKTRLRVSVGAIGVLLLIGFALAAGTVLVVDDPKPSDLIVVLAGETDHRPALALELLRRGYAKRMLIDVPADVTIFEFSELDLAQRYINDLPDPALVSICPIRSLSTRDETHDVEKCLTPQDGSRILIVTSDFHTRRALSIFRHELRGKSFSIAASHDLREFGERWWTHRQWAKTCSAEWVRTIWWNAVDRWR
jgi:uncharacterized SAM-binding protein YcdF (DUF218 family)